MVQQEKCLFERFGFDGHLTKGSSVLNVYSEYSDISRLGIDDVYFTANQPTIFVKYVSQFDDKTLKDVAKTQRAVWNYTKVMLLYVVAPTEVRIYNCFERPVYVSSNKCDESAIEKLELGSFSLRDVETDLELINNTFSRIAIDSGSIWDYDKIKKIDYRRKVDNYLADSLKRADERLEKEGLSKEIVHGLLLRSLFILFLEDKGSAKEAGLYDRIKPGSKSYLDILDDKDATYRLFDELKKHFNGDITGQIAGEKDSVRSEHLAVVKKCFTDGDISGNPKLFDDWRVFDFSIIRVELLSMIYEKFLGETRKEKGQYYTPSSLVELMLNELLPIGNGDFNVKILDPACGSGIFLVESYRRLVARWKNSNPGKSISFEILKNLLLDNIYGIEIDEIAIRVASFGLYLSLIEQLDPKTLWIRDDHRLPYLICGGSWTAKAKQGKNLFLKDTISEIECGELPAMDLVVGNPPYGTKNLSDEIKDYCRKYGFAQEYVLPFLHKATQFCPSGRIAMIFNIKVLTNTNGAYKKFREWLFEENTVDKVYNFSILRNVPKRSGSRLFVDATAPICIAFYTHGKNSNNSESIKYCAPVSYIRAGIYSGIVLNDSDISYLPQYECKKSDTKIWKIAQWGNKSCFDLIGRVYGQYDTLSKTFSAKKWITGRGLNADSQHPDFCPTAMIDAKKLNRYCSAPQDVKIANTKWYRKNKEGLFKAPFVIFKEAQHNLRLSCSLFEESWYVNTSAFVMKGESLDDMKVLTAYLNSKLVEFFLFMTSSSWGVERERILFNEIENLPSPFSSANYGYYKAKIVDAFDHIVALRKSVFSKESAICEQENVIFDCFANMFDLSEYDRELIDDTLNFSLDLFTKGDKAKGLKPARNEEMTVYGEKLLVGLKSMLGENSLQVGIHALDVNAKSPLCLVVVSFGDVAEDVQMLQNNSLQATLTSLDKLLMEERSESIYVKKNLTYYTGNKVYIVKPNQKRFWSKSQATEDSMRLIGDILNMEE